MTNDHIYADDNIRTLLHIPSFYLLCFPSPSVGKSCMTLLTMARYEWFEEWKETKLGKRGQDYLDLKNSMARELLNWALTVFPQLRDKVSIHVA